MAKLKIENIVKPSIKGIAKYVPGESPDKNSSKFIKLSSNESPFEVPVKNFSFINKILRNSHLYPDGDCLLLKKSIGERFKLKSNQIICGNGSDDILSIICQAFSREGSEVICSEYGFIYYPIIAKAAGCKVVTARTEQLSVSCKNILMKINKKTKIIFIANPNNPTGSIIFKKELIKFLDKVPSKIIVVLDGAYSEFIKDKSYTDGVDLVNKYKNLIITRTFSKIFGLAGLRLGWGYSNKEIINLMERIRGPFNVNLIAQHIGSLILKDNEFLKKSIDHNEKWRQYLPKKLNELGFKVKTSYTNFVLVEVDKKKYSKEKILNVLKKNKIIVRDMKSYNLQNFFRVSIGRDSHMKKFLKVLKSSLDN